MTPEQCVMAYAQAFEETYRDDDWERLAPYFAEDASYEVRGGALSCTIEGREAIFRGLKKSLDGLDRRCDSRRVEITDGPETHAEPPGDRVEIGWRASYERGKAPPLRFAGRSLVSVVDGRILRLVDEYPDAEVKQLTEWMLEHGQGLDGSYV